MLRLEKAVAAADVAVSVQSRGLWPASEFVGYGFPGCGVCDGESPRNSSGIYSRASIDTLQAFFPPTPLPNLYPSSMNWSSVVFTGVAVWGVIFYFVWARFRYVGPVEYVRKLD